MRDAASRRFKLIVFDWDGTLADSTAIIGHAIQSACRELGEPVPDDRAARFVIGLGLADAIRLVAPALPESRHSEFADRYRAYYLQRELDVPMFSGAEALLTTLSDAGYKLAVATGKSRSGLDQALSRNGLTQRFNATRCADEGYPKPHPDMLLRLMACLDATPSETLMVGDTTHDLEMARNAGVSSLAVSYGAHRIDDFNEYVPLAMIRTIEEMRTWLEGAG